MVIPQFAQAGLGHVVDARQHISEPRLGIDAVELCRGDQAAHDRRPLAAAIGSAKQPCFPLDGNPARVASGGVVCETQPAIAEEAGEAVPAGQYVVHRLGHRSMAGEPGALRPHPVL